MDELMQLKDKMVKQLAKQFDERERVDPELADAIKDISEAAYYCRVTEQMGPSGYQGGGQMGYMPMGYMHDGVRYGYMEPMGYQARDSRGRFMGYGDAVEGVRNIVNGATPEEKERIKAELRSMM